MKSVDVSELDIVPLKNVDSKVCEIENCGDLLPTWSVDGILSCSSCLLHTVLSEQSEQLESMIEQVETSLGAVFPRDRGRLKTLAADRIAGGIVLAQRVEAMRKKVNG